MKRAFWITTVVVALLAMTALPALAAGGKVRHRWDGTLFALVGQVTAIDAANLTITVQVLKGPLEGETVTVSTDASTRFLQYGECPMDVIGFEDVEVEDYASVGGLVLDDGVYLANRVTVDIPLEP